MRAPQLMRVLHWRSGWLAPFRVGMPRHSLPGDRSARLLARGRLVRIGFQDTAAPYLIPLGYVFLHSALYGVTEPGRKTRVAAVNPSVAFQVDTSSESGLWEWESVTGEGRFEIVTGKAEKEHALSALQPLLEAAPDWWRREQAARISSGALLVWKVVPTLISGCRYAPSWRIGQSHPSPDWHGGIMGKSGAKGAGSPSESIDARIRSLGDWRGEMLSRIRALIRAADPTVVEEWKWEVPVWSHDGLICTGETYKKVVKMTFARGASLKDPSGLFNSSLAGNTRRAIDIHEGDRLNEKALKALIRAAVAFNKASARG